MWILKVLFILAIAYYAIRWSVEDCSETGRHAHAKPDNKRVLRAYKKFKDLCNKLNKNN